MTRWEWKVVISIAKVVIYNKKQMRDEIEFLRQVIQLENDIEKNNDISRYHEPERGTIK